jgi:hypothetical protein
VVALPEPIAMEDVSVGLSVRTAVGSRQRAPFWKSTELGPGWFGPGAFARRCLWKRGAHIAKTPHDNCW